MTDLLNILMLLDNPLQDVPAIAALRSPLVGLSLDQLADIRLAVPDGHFWTALQRWHEVHAPESKLQNHERSTDGVSGNPQSAVTRNGEGVESFLNCFNRWRRLSRQVSLSRCLETILAETRYEDWLRGQSEGGQRCANVRQLVRLARRFDEFQRQGLLRFLRYIQAQQEAGAEPDVAAVIEEDAVRLMSIHQSKGLEFPVVAVADLGKPFNFSDLHAEIILDEVYGLCPLIKPPHIGGRYPAFHIGLAGSVKSERHSAKN